MTSISQQDSAPKDGPRGRGVRPLLLASVAVVAVGAGLGAVVVFGGIFRKPATDDAKDEEPVRTSATDEENRERPPPDRPTRPELIPASRLGADPMLVAWSPDGKTLAVAAGYRKTARVVLWDVAAGKERASWGAETAFLVFSPDGTKLATHAVRPGEGESAARFQAVALWDAATGKPGVTLRHPNPVFLARFSPDGRTLAAGTTSTTDEGLGWPQVVFWDVNTAKDLGDWQGLKRLDAEQRENQPRDRDWNVGGQVHELAFSPDSRRLAVSGRDGSVQFWDVRAGVLLNEWAPNGRDVDLGCRVAYSPDGRSLATTNGVLFTSTTSKKKGVPRAVLLWDVAGVRGLRKPELMPLLALQRADGIGAWIGGFALLSASQASRRRSWEPDVAAGRLYRRLSAPPEQPSPPRVPANTPPTFWTNAPAGQVLFAADGRTLAYLAYPHPDEAATFQLWDVARARMIVSLGEKEVGDAAVLYAAPGGSVLALTARDGRVNLIDGRTGEVRAVLREHKERVRDVAFSSDGHRLATAGDDGVRLWEVPKAP
jgi:WD40 repeat protein